MMRQPRRRSLLSTTLAPFGFALVGFALGSGVVPVRYPGPLVVVTLALALAATVVDGFIRAEVRWPVAVSLAGVEPAGIGRLVTLYGPSARLQTGRVLVVATVAIAAALYEWTHRGWIREYFGAGSGPGALIVVVGVFVGMGALAGVLHGSARGSRRQRALGALLLTVQLGASAGAIVLGWIEANHRGTIGSILER